MAKHLSKYGEEKHYIPSPTSISPKYSWTEYILVLNPHSIHACRDNATVSHTLQFLEECRSFLFLQ